MDLIPLQDRISEETLQTLSEIRRGRNPNRIAKETYQLARTLENSTHLGDRALSLRIYQDLSKDASMGIKAGHRLEVLRGGGSSLEQAAEFARNFLPQVWNGPSVLSFFLATGLGHLAGTGVADKFLRSGKITGFWARGGIRALAGVARTGVEVPALLLAEKGLRRYFWREPVEMDPRRWGPEFFHLLKTWGLLRLTGAASRASFDRLHKINPGTLEAARLPALVSFTRLAFPQLSMGAAIFASYSLEDSRKEQGAGKHLIDALGFVITANILGHFSRYAMPPALRHWMNQTEIGLKRVERSGEPRKFSDAWTGLREKTLRHSEGLFRVHAALPGGMHFPLPLPEINSKPPPHSPRENSFFAKSNLPEGRESGNGLPLKPQVIEKRLDQMTRPDFSPRHFQAQDLILNKRPPKIKKIGVVLSGGNGPGENALLERLVLRGIQNYDWDIFGFFKGFKGLVDPRGIYPRGRIWPLSPADVTGEAAVREAHRRIFGIESSARSSGHRSIGTMGGDLIGSSRLNPLEGDPQAEKIHATMKRFEIDALVVVGGNGTQRLARELAARRVPLVFIPQSIDNDVPGTMISVGFPTAVNRGAAGIFELMNVSHSCGNVFLNEVMGQNFGELALSIGLATRKGSFHLGIGQPGRPIRVESVFTELPRPFEEVSKVIRQFQKRGDEHGVLLFSEGVKFREPDFTPPTAKDQRGRLQIDTGDVVKFIRKKLAEQGITNVRTFAPGYSLRGSDPTSHDIQLAHRMADGALELLEQGGYGHMVGLKFLGNSSLMVQHYPRLSEVLASPKKLNPDYEGFVRAYLENGNSG